MSAPANRSTLLTSTATPGALPPRYRERSPAHLPLPNALAYRVDEVPLMGGPRRTALYALAKAGKLKLVRVAGRTLVDGDSLRDLLRNGTN